MTVRVTQEDVADIIDLDSSEDASAFIIAASLIVDEQLSGQGYSELKKKEIERWLAAHFVAIKNPVLKSEKIGDATDTYVGFKIGAGLDATPYGQQAMTLDTNGLLANLGKIKAGMDVMHNAYDGEA